MATRKLVSLGVGQQHVYGLADDGTVWVLHAGLPRQGWVEVVGIPQPVASEVIVASGTGEAGVVVAAPVGGVGIGKEVPGRVGGGRSG